MMIKNKEDEMDDKKDKDSESNMFNFSFAAIFGNYEKYPEKWREIFDLYNKEKLIEMKKEKT